MTTADPNRVILTGENPFIRLSGRRTGCARPAGRSSTAATSGSNRALILVTPID